MADGADADMAEAPLLPGWGQVWSEEQQCYYYWHAATKQSSWDRPSMPDAAGTESGVDAGTEQSYEGEGAEDDTVNYNTPATPQADSKGKGKGKAKGKSGWPTTQGASGQPTGFRAPPATGGKTHGPPTHQNVQESCDIAANKFWRPSANQAAVPGKGGPSPPMQPQPRQPMAASGKGAKPGFRPPQQVAKRPRMY